jgi:hypothetical protein
VPGLAAPRRIRRRLHRAGFVDVRLHWAWPLAQRSAPLMWVPVDTPAAAERFIALRPARSRRQALLRRGWRAAARFGLLAPVSVLARRPGPPPRTEDPIDRLLAPRVPCALLTGGRREINKVVAMPLAQDGWPPHVVKFARVPEAEAGLAHEAEVLRALAAERPGVVGVPRVLAVGRRAGRLAVAETAIHGESLIDALTPATFPVLAHQVTDWLVDLAGSAAPRPRADWWPRLVERPLDDFARRFGQVTDAAVLSRARAQLHGLGDLPMAWEHRDCAPWNLMLTPMGPPALLDWESAEAQGLPGLDLVYFLANAAFLLEGALESGRTRGAYARLLDQTTPIGAVAAACLKAYCARLGLDADALNRLRLLCWIIHCRSDHRHLDLDSGGSPDPGALAAGAFLGLVHEELDRARS